MTKNLRLLEKSIFMAKQIETLLSKNDGSNKNKKSGPPKFNADPYKDTENIRAKAGTGELPFDVTRDPKYRAIAEDVYNVRPKRAVKIGEKKPEEGVYVSTGRHRGEPLHEGPNGAEWFIPFDEESAREAADPNVPTREKSDIFFMTVYRDDSPPAGQDMGEYKEELQGQFIQHLEYNAQHFVPDPEVIAAYEEYKNTKDDVIERALAEAEKRRSAKGLPPLDSVEKDTLRKKADDDYRKSVNSRLRKSTPAQRDRLRLQVLWEFGKYDDPAEAAKPRDQRKEPDFVPCWKCGTRLHPSNTRLSKEGAGGVQSRAKAIYNVEHGNNPNRYDMVYLDRIRTMAEGGSYTLDNVLPCCARCNAQRGDQRLFDDEGNHRLSELMDPSWQEKLDIGISRYEGSEISFIHASTAEDFVRVQEEVLKRYRGKNIPSDVSEGLAAERAKNLQSTFGVGRLQGDGPYARAIKYWHKASIGEKLTPMESRDFIDSITPIVDARVNKLLSNPDLDPERRQELENYITNFSADIGKGRTSKEYNDAFETFCSTLDVVEYANYVYQVCGGSEPIDRATPSGSSVGTPAELNQFYSKLGGGYSFPAVRPRKKGDSAPQSTNAPKVEPSETSPAAKQPRRRSPAPAPEPAAAQEAPAQTPAPTPAQRRRAAAPAAQAPAPAPTRRRQPATAPAAEPPSPQPEPKAEAPSAPVKPAPKPSMERPGGVLQGTAPKKPNVHNDLFNMLKRLNA